MTSRTAGNGLVSWVPPKWVEAQTTRTVESALPCLPLAEGALDGAFHCVGAVAVAEDGVGDAGALAGFDDAIDVFVRGELVDEHRAIGAAGDARDHVVHLSWLAAVDPIEIAQAQSPAECVARLLSRIAAEHQCRTAFEARQVMPTLEGILVDLFIDLCFVD